MGYTQDEIRATVGRLLVSNVRYDVDTVTGNRQIDVTFTDVQESAAATFVMYQAAPLHVAKLATKRIASYITSYQDELGELYDEVLSLKRVNQLVNPLTPLANTTSALTELEGVVRSGKFKNLQSIPSYQRFTNGAASFLSTVKPSVVSNVLGGQQDVVPSKQQAMSGIPGRVAALPESFGELHQNVVYFNNAISDYAALNLPNVLAQNVVRRARNMLQSRYDNLAAMTLEKQQELLKDATLEMLTAKGVLASLSAFEPPPANPPASGTVMVYADVDHPLSAPATVATKQEPYLLHRGVDDILHLKIDGAHDFDIDLPAIDETYIEGFLPAPFSFNSTGTAASLKSLDTTGPYDFTGGEGHLKFLFEKSVGGTYQKWDIDVLIPMGGPYDEWQICGFAATEFMAKMGSAIFSMWPDGLGFKIIPEHYGPGYRAAVMDGDANQKLGFIAGTSSPPGTYRNDQLVFSYKTAPSFTVTFPSGTQTIDTVVATINAAVLAAGLAAQLQAVVQQYTGPNGSIKQYCRVVLLDAADPDVKLVVTGTTVPGQQPASGIGMEGEVSHTKLTAARLAEFLTKFEDGGPPVRKLADYVTAGVVPTGVRITSKGSTTTASRIEVSGTAADVLFSTSQLLGIGASRWYVMSEANANLGVGDIIELWETDVDWATITARSGTNLLYTNFAMLCDRVYPFAATGPLHAIAERGDRTSFDELVAMPEMKSFVADDHSRFFSELTRATNSMLADKNPTEAEINTVLGLLAQHSSELDAVNLLLGQLQAYPCRPVDELFRSLNEKGSDKAVDTLLQCRFSEFFGLDVKTSSYAGTVMSGLQTVAQQDVPVVKFDRVKGARSIIATAESPDYETDFSDGVPDDSKYSVDKA
jgi:hypothetical protein